MDKKIGYIDELEINEIPKVNNVNETTNVQNLQGKEPKEEARAFAGVLNPTADKDLFRKFRLTNEVNPADYIENINNIANTTTLGNTNQEWDHIDIGDVEELLKGEEQSLVQIENRSKSLPTIRGFWSKFKALLNTPLEWEKKIIVELTPYQQKVEDDINKFLATPINTDKIWNKIHDFFFQDIKF